MMQVIILRRQREKIDEGHRLDYGITRINSGRVRMTGSMSTEPGSGEES